MIITKRRRRKSKKQASTKPEDVYIAFATNRPGIHLEKYARRWMIETGYRVMENQRVRTRSRTVAARTLCFLYSMLIYNIRGMANASTTNDRVYPRVTQTDLLLNVLVEMFPWELITGVPPDGQCECACSCHRASPAGIMPV